MTNRVFENKKVVVTGGSDGIGFAIAEEFAKKGAAVLIVGRDMNKLILAKEKLKVYNGVVKVISADLGKMKELESLSNEIQ